jgi:hypothetical protein
VWPLRNAIALYTAAQFLRLRLRTVPGLVCRVRVAKEYSCTFCAQVCETGFRRSLSLSLPDQTSPLNHLKRGRCYLGDEPVGHLRKTICAKRSILIARCHRRMT